MLNRFLGIDTGGTRVKWCLTDEKGIVLERHMMNTNDNPGDIYTWRDYIMNLIEETALSTEANGGRLQCGISAPGLVDDQNKMILYMPERLKGIERFNWSEACGRPITVLNDGHAAALAEYETAYRQIGISHFLMLTLGTGVGGGLIINGKLYQGYLQRAGHMGHMTLDINGKQTMTNIPGSLEYAIGNFSLKERTQGKYTDTKELVEAYKNGDATAKGFWLASIDHLAAALASLTNILSPEVICIGGGITEGANEILLDPLRSSMERFEWRPGGYGIQIERAKLGTFAGAIGAAMFTKLKVTK